MVESSSRKDGSRSQGLGMEKDGFGLSHRPSDDTCLEGASV